MKQGNYPWHVLERPRAEIQSAFLSKKIIITTFSKNAPYSLDYAGYFSNDKTIIIPSSDLFLLGVLNSNIVDTYFKTIASTKANGYFEYKPMYINQLPIPHATPAQQAEIAALVEQVLAAKAAGEPTAALEASIDALVAARYGLSPAEVAQLGG